VRTRTRIILAAALLVLVAGAVFRPLGFQIAGLASAAFSLYLISIAVLFALELLGLRGEKGLLTPRSTFRRDRHRLENELFHFDSPKGRADLGEVYFRAGKYAKAAENFRKVTEASPELARPFLRLGQCFLKAKQYPEAEQALRTAETNDVRREYPDVALSLFDALYAQNRLDDAEVVLDEFLRLNYGSPAAHYRRASLYERTGRTREAHQEFRRVTEFVKHLPKFRKREDAHWLWKARWHLLFLAMRPSAEAKAGGDEG